MAAPDNEEPVAPGTPTIQDVVAEVVKSAEGVKDQGDGVVGGNADQVSEAAIAVEPSLPSFKEESYFVADLKESEKKALQDFKVRVESAIREKEFVPPVQQEAPVVADDKNVEKVESGSAAEPADNGLAEEEKVESLAVTIETLSETAPLADASPIAAEVRNAEAAVQTEAAPAPASTAVETEPEVPRPDSAEALQETPNEDGVLALEDLSLWGIPLLHTKGDERTDVLLLKFLRARDFKVNNAFTMLKNTVLWRQKFGADGLLEEDLGSELNSFACMCGFDKDGHPVCFNNFGAFQDKELYQKTFGDQTKISHFLRWRVQLLERGIQQLTFSPGGANSMIQVIDLKNSPWPAKKELRVATSQALTLLQDNYPELVVKNILINVPWYFTALYSMISPFLTQRTKSKFVVAGVGKVAETLFKFMSPEHVPVQYGGLGQPDDAEFLGAGASVTTLVVKAGEKKTIELPLTESGGNVLWDLAVAGWDITYGAEYIPSQVSSYVTIIEKSKKVLPQGEPLRNSFKASEPGKVVLTLDNMSSRRKRIVHYRYIIKDIQVQSS